MSDRTVVVTYAGFDPTDDSTAGALRRAGFNIRCEPRLSYRGPSEVAELMRDATAGILSTDPFDRSVFEACPDLRILARIGVGTDAIDIPAATEAGVAVTITPDANTEAVADHTLALALACCRRVLENDRAIRDGAWDRHGPLMGVDLAGSTVGLVGLGGIGRAVARRLAGFGVEILAYDQAEAQADGVTRVDLDTLLRTASVVSIHVPLVESTRGLIGAEEIAKMRPGAMLVNTARGGIVDEAAMVTALRSGHLAAAGLDVFDLEPPSGSPLLELPNVVLTPHIAGVSINSQQKMLEMATRSVLDIAADRSPFGIVNPGALRGATTSRSVA
ncbi:MAG: phosphoglycerate dehydrogenase [Actinobacteria bacterium]|nr:phosphoglycerate dehydrogenase [Actinomycetota bacterium]